MLLVEQNVMASLKIAHRGYVLGERPHRIERRRRRTGWVTTACAKLISASDN